MADVATRLSLDAGTPVDLYAILTPADVVLFRLTPGPLAGADVRFGGQAYEACSITVEGAGYGEARRARPELVLSRVDVAATGDPRGDDWLGYQLRHRRTVQQHLDGQSAADANAYGESWWWIERESSRTPEEIRFGLTRPLAAEGVKLPVRQVLRNICAWRYRRWDGNAFDNDEATCPYRGNKYWTAANVSTTEAAKDECNRRISGCKLRFPNQKLPFGGFPGVGGAGRRR